MLNVQCLRAPSSSPATSSAAPATAPTTPTPTRPSVTSASSISPLRKSAWRNPGCSCVQQAGVQSVGCGVWGVGSVGHVEDVRLEEPMLLLWQQAGMQGVRGGVWEVQGLLTKSALRSPGAAVGSKQDLRGARYGMSGP
eukprot:357916-Chlamydomonas_euryale.AAC.4